jgi:hypothetical protein
VDFIQGNFDDKPKDWLPKSIDDLEKNSFFNGATPDDLKEV